MKKWILRLAVLALVLGAIAVGALFYFLNDIFKTAVQTVGPQLTKSELRLAKAKLSPFSGQAQMTDLFVGNPEGWKSESAIKVGHVKVALNVRSALADTVMIDSIHIQAPEITYETGLGGSNLSKLLENIEAVAGGGQPAETTTSKSSKKFRVKEIHIHGAKAHVSALGKQLTVPLADIHLHNVGTDANAATAAELAREIIKPLLASVIKAAAEAASDMTQQLKAIGTGALTNQLDKATGALKDLFKKK